MTPEQFQLLYGVLKGINNTLAWIGFLLLLMLILMSRRCTK